MALLSQGLNPHLSKSGVNRLADWGTALGFCAKLLSYLEELGFFKRFTLGQSSEGRDLAISVCAVPL